MNRIEINQLSKLYGSFPALNNLSLNLQSGKIVGLAGPNGSGKTTLLRILAGLDQAYSGEVMIDGHLTGTPEAKATVSYLPDRPFLSEWMTANQVIKLYQEFFADFDNGKAAELLRFFKLDGNQKLKTMSKGMKEKVQILLTISRQAKVYLLDEPISGVDPATRKVIMQSIIRNYAEDALLLIATHLLYDIEPIIDDVVFLEHGGIRLYASAEDLRAKENKSINTIFEEVFQ